MPLDTINKKVTKLNETKTALEKELDTIEHLRNEGEKFYEAFMELLGKYIDIEE